MRTSLLFAVGFSCLSFTSCQKDDAPPTAPPTPAPGDYTKTVAPNETDASIQTLDNNLHYVSFLRSTTAKNKLVVFMGGSNSNTERLRLFCDFAASKGFHVINLAYPNNVAAEACANSSDTGCARKFRAEIAFGTDGSPLVSVNATNSIENRLKKLLDYLVQKDPGNNWNQYLENGTVAWSKTILSGHSQGAGHAAYIAKIKAVNRVIMFSGPNDFHNAANAPFNWLFFPSATPAASYFAFLHQRDEANPFAEQRQNVQALGLAAPTLTDNLTPPFGNANSLYTNLEPSNTNPPGAPYHGSTVTDRFTPLVGGVPRHSTVWNYMLGL